MKLLWSEGEIGADNVTETTIYIVNNGKEATGKDRGA